VNDTVKLLAGPFLALVPIFVWELFVKPQRLRVQIARLLRVEIRINLAVLIRTRIWREKSSMGIARDFFPSDEAFKSLANQMGELPPQALESVLMLYRQLKHLDTIAIRFREMVATFGNRAKESPGNSQDNKRLRVGALDAFDETLRHAERLCSKATAELNAILEAHWTFEEIALPTTERLERGIRSEIEQTIDRRRAAERNLRSVVSAAEANRSPSK
jgi:hypothetical protein